MDVLVEMHGTPPSFGGGVRGGVTISFPSGKSGWEQMQFPDRKRGFFCSGKKLLLAKVDSVGCPTGETYGRVKTKGLRGGVPRYVAQASPQVD